MLYQLTRISNFSQRIIVHFGEVYFFLFSQHLLQTLVSTLGNLPGNKTLQFLPPCGVLFINILPTSEHRTGENKLEKIGKASRKGNEKNLHFETKWQISVEFIIFHITSLASFAFAIHQTPKICHKSMKSNRYWIIRSWMSSCISIS